MALGNLKISHNFAGETGFIIAVPKLTIAPLADVLCTIDGTPAQTRKVYPAPHSQRSLLIEGLLPEFYFIKFWRSSDGVTLDAEILTLAGNAATGAVYPTERYEYIVDRGNDNTTPPGTGTEVWTDPTSTTDILRDERLKDKVYEIEIRGMGTVAYDEYNDRSDLGGGFDIVSGFQWEAGMRVFIRVAIPQNITTSGPSVSGGGEVTDVVVITDNTDFEPTTHAGKLIICEFTAGIRKLTLGNFSTLPDCFFKIQTHGCTKFAGIQFDVGNTAKVRGMNLNAIWLGIGEEASVLVKSNIVYIVKAPKGYDFLGERIWGDMLAVNTLFRDGTQYNQSDVPRLMQFIDLLPGSFVVSEGVGAGQWARPEVVNGETVYPFKGKYARTDTGTPKIRVPDDRDRSLHSLASVVADAADAERMSINPGSYRHFKTSMKGVIIGLRNGVGGSATGSIAGTGFSGQDNFSNWFATTDHIRFNNAADGFSGKDVTREAGTGMLPLVRI